MIPFYKSTLIHPVGRTLGQEDFLDILEMALFKEKQLSLPGWLSRPHPRTSFAFRHRFHIIVSVFIISR
jgi:hypothetical protein